VAASVAPRQSRLVGWLGLITAAGMWVVLIAGDTVTSTGSQTGCGPDWPLCRGRFIPTFAFNTAVEYTHRVLAAGETILVVALVLCLLRLYWRRVAARVLSVLLIGSLFLQAGMGAWAVLRPQDAVVLALHFGISLIAVAAAMLAAFAARWPATSLSARPVGRGVAIATWAAMAYLYVLVYSGAYISHAAAAAACPGWPLCGPQGAGGWDQAIDLIHRSAAAGGLIVAAGLLLVYLRFAAGRRDLITGAAVFVASVLAEGAAGAYLVMDRWQLTGELIHAGVTAFAFSALSYLCFRVSLGRAAARHREGLDGPRLESGPVGSQAG
jgi:cytochrome c oxidase assembly protein subunit 15